MGEMTLLLKESEVMADTGETCFGCGERITGFATDGYCEDCLCSECGTPLETDNERAVCICDECEGESDG